MTHPNRVEVFTGTLLATSLATSLCLADTPFPSTYQPPSHTPTLITNATILTGTGQKLEAANLYFVDGKIVAVGAEQPNLSEETRIIDANGGWVTPGIIDVHSHLGVYPSPGVDAHSDGNEATAPVTAEVWAEHSVWPQDPGFGRALAGGITTMQILPGSANLFGGRGVTLKNVASITYQGMKFPDAPYGLKMACGENPKRVYGRKGSGPSTRMGNIAGYRAAWIKATDYRDEHANYAALSDVEKKETSKPKRDLELETLAGVLDGEIIIHMHCYRADEMMTILDLAKEFNYRVGTFHHGVEAYKISAELAENGVCGALWADWWGFKMEAFDGIPENIALVDRPKNSCAIVHSDSPEGIQRLNQEAAKVMASARRARMPEITPEHAITWMTANAAKALGIEGQTGTLEAGKMADVVVWNGNPFSSYALAEQVFIDGRRLYDRSAPAATPRSDFQLGQEVR